jgi:hypothetical protein
MQKYKGIVNFKAYDSVAYIVEDDGKLKPEHNIFDVRIIDKNNLTYLGSELFYKFKDKEVEITIKEIGK